MASKFSITEKGFVMQFDSGWVVSVQFGAGNYCARRDRFGMRAAKVDLHECSDAEIGVWSVDDKDGDMTIIGWQSVENVAKVIAVVAALPPTPDNKLAAEKLSALGL